MLFALNESLSTYFMLWACQSSPALTSIFEMKRQSSNSGGKRSVEHLKISSFMNRLCSEPHQPGLTNPQFDSLPLSTMCLGVISNRILIFFLLPLLTFVCTANKSKTHFTPCIKMCSVSGYVVQIRKST